VSADRKYVTLEVNPRFTDFSLAPFLTANGPVQVPTNDITTVRTYGSVPDQGTLLVGGLKQAGEIEVEAGVPVISKIPVLKRAFTNRTRVKDERVLLILLKPKIIIQEESEQQAFPTLNVSERTGP
jgi:type II secretory pathway component GspD/PulD (secretin)